MRNIIPLLLASLLAACAVRADEKWITLFDGTGLDGWDQLGNANWNIADGIVQATAGKGFLVTKESFVDFELLVEFWVDEPANSGVFLRCEDRRVVTDANAYEVNIFDRRPEPRYGTGAIVGVAAVDPMPKAGGRWNTYEISARGNVLTVTLNGVRTVDAVHDTKHAAGPIALQYGSGLVKFRRVLLRRL
ncbi:DUF1080 domain-containing protein [Oleiharenicola lentus]|uniref:DUF1080 domain-containing protein n=1 Tax=Oleiharenicola lentus TaxID=2508720 RepID=A0A4Q1CBA9_9BACT|nr:DUF1080 domain-containing protein [Oleiharenicola lentus]RXK56385.1 DUF1080 domain-containing protein [Oleiharenicola lentus]